MANNGGPAFPQDVDEHVDGLTRTRVRGGMSLRDYFAALAMQAYVAKAGPASDEDGEFVALYAYQIADAMLVERSKEPQRGLRGDPVVQPGAQRSAARVTRRRRFVKGA